MDTLIFPTRERIRHSGDRYLAPATDQKFARPYGRVRSCWDMMEIARGGAEPVLDPEQAMAGREVSMLWGSVFAPRGITGSYGSQRWNGTPVAQLASLLAPEWRETCRRRLIQAELSVAEAEDWHALIAVVSRDGTARDAGRALGYGGRSAQIKRGVESLRRSLGQLAVHFGFTTGPGACRGDRGVLAGAGPVRRGVRRGW